MWILLFLDKSLSFHMACVLKRLHYPLTNFMIRKGNPASSSDFLKCPYFLSCNQFSIYSGLINKLVDFTAHYSIIPSREMNFTASGHRGLPIISCHEKVQYLPQDTCQGWWPEQREWSSIVEAKLPLFSDYRAFCPKRSWVCLPPNPGIPMTSLPNHSSSFHIAFHAQV